MLDFIKGLLKKPEPAPRKKRRVLKLDDMDSFLDSYMEEVFDKVKDRIEDMIIQSKDNVKELDANLEGLGSAKLRNDNIHHRERQIMEGNRESFIAKHDQFTTNLRFPDQLDFNSSLKFCLDARDGLESIKETTGRSSLILKEFFANDVSRINRNLSKIERNITEMLNLIASKDSQRNDLEKTRENMKELVSAIELKAHLDKEHKRAKKRVDDLGLEITQTEKEMSDIEASEEFKEAADLRSKRENMSGKLNAEKSAFKTKFQRVDKALRKYERVAMDGIDVISSYLNDAAEALMEDDDLKIIDILRTLNESINKGSLGIKDKIKEKTITDIKSLDKTALNSIKERLLGFRSHSKEFNNRLRSITCVRDHEESAYRIEHLKEKMVHLEKDLSSLNDRIEKTDIQNKREGMQNILSELTESKVRLID